MDMAVLNSCNCYLVKNFIHPPKNNFIHDLVYQLLEKYASVAQKKGKHSTRTDPPERLSRAEGISNNYSDKMEMEAALAKKKSDSRLCRVC